MERQGGRRAQATDIAQLTADTYYRRGRGGASSLRRVRDAAAPSGTMFNYSSADTFALGLVLRGATGGDLAAYAAEKLWQPLGAESAASWLADSSSAEAAFCCINARLRDYGRLGLLLAHDGEAGGRQVVPRAFLLDATDAARQPEYLKPPRRATPFFGYGYQIWLYPYRTRTFQARGLFGQELIVQPSSRIVVVMTSALRTPDTPSEIFVERSYFVGSILKALGGKPMFTARMQIRRAEAADEEALVSIRRRAILALAVPAMSREQAEGWATRGAADRVARAMREHDVWVAVEGVAIGWVEVDRDRVAALYVSPSYSRRGVGSVLLTFAETSIRNSGYTTARLESSQNALDYYLRRGYLRCGPADSDGAWPLRKNLAAVTPNQGIEPTR